MRSLPFVLAVLLWPAVASAQTPLTFTKDIAPIIWSRCASCHRPGEIGPFSLLTYEDVRRHAAQIAAVTARRIMPPWKPVAGKGTFQNERRLGDRELSLLQRWIAEGAAEGGAADRSQAPPLWNDGWQLGPPDLVVRMPEEYTVAADGSDVFRTFVLPIPVDRPRYVRAIEFHPGNARVVHHANLGVDRTRSSRQLDARDAEPGYDGSMERDARYPEGQLLGWTPGQAPHPAPDGTQWRLEPGSDLVVQLHLQPTGKRERVGVIVGFYFTDTPPQRTPAGLRLGSQTIDIPPDAGEYVVTDRYALPVDVEVVAVQPHAHNLARRMEAEAQLPDGTTRWLIAIDDWDFRWQDVYRYATPLTLPKGTVLSMRYAYDNSAANPRNPHRPPARVVWGQNTSDEMGDLWLQVIPRAAADEALLTADFRRKASADDLAAYTGLLRRDPGNPLRHDAVAALYLDAGRLDEAIAEFRESLRLNRESAPTQYNLGFALSARGRRDEAIAAFQEALRIDPDYAQAHNNLGALLQLGGQADAALEHFRRATILRPDNVEAHANLGQLLSNRGRLPEAAAQFAAVLALNPDHVQALGGLAWIRATAADASLRDPASAITLAVRADAAARHQDVTAIDALAAAYAAAGRYDQAVRVARQGLALALASDKTEVAAQFRLRVDMYQSGQALYLPQP
ncbi:MAG: Tetratricopeptide 2 repeat protein [Acidobacteria bacterium]|nr:Tetratricopeptide 2 repeat protein [Acidobacteriota bacterium]